MCSQLEVVLEDHLCLPSNGKLYSKVISWVQRSLWENGEPLEKLMEEVSTAVLFVLCLLFSPPFTLSSSQPFSNQRFNFYCKAHAHPTDLMIFFFYIVFCIPSLFFFIFFVVLFFASPPTPPLPSPSPSGVFKSIYFAIGTVRGCYTLCKGERLVQVSSKAQSDSRAFCCLTVVFFFFSFLSRCVCQSVSVRTYTGVKKLTVFPPH